ncbi:Glycosyltransferase [hydrothermal vent metagenome]|uniref:Glycosyltransferase n=1 Tax=hydrothermal vent metagenome TaxID=652676 RepID=A0A1W1BBV1_9ZZZZ
MALGYQVTLVSGSYSHLFSQLPKTQGKFTHEMIDGIEYIWVKVPKYRSSKSIGRIWNMLSFAWNLRSLKISGAPHVLVSSPSLFPIKIAKKWVKRFQSKLFFEVRDIWPLTLVELSNLTSTHPLIRVMEYYEKFAYRHADKVISLLPAAQEHFVSQGMRADKFVYLPNGIEIEGGELAPLPSSLEMKIPKEKFIVAYAGTIGLANNLGYLVEAAETLKTYRDIHFIILGQGGETQELQNRVQKLGLENITFVGAVKKEMVGSFLKKVDVAFISLLPEKLFRFGVSPNKVFEYMYAKKPIVWAVEAGNNLVEEAQCGISVPLNNVSKLKEAILELKLLSREKREELGQNGYNFVNTHHSYRMLAEKLIKIIEE